MTGEDLLFVSHGYLGAVVRRWLSADCERRLEARTPPWMPGAPLRSRCAKTEPSLSAEVLVIEGKEVPENAAVWWPGGPTLL
jgi:hypothetical protein